MNGLKISRIAVTAALAAAALLMSCPDVGAAPGIFKKKTKDKTEIPVPGQAPVKSDPGKQLHVLHYIVENGDTVFVDWIRPCWCYGKGKNYKGINWRRHSKLVYNFNKVYPYAKMGRLYVQKVDSTLAGGNYSRKERRQLINNCQDQLLKDFEPVIRKMTISQGQLLCRLIDREIDKTAFQIVKDYKNGFSAGFWQGVAKLFKQDLKSHYDPDGADAYTEQLIHMWNTGEYDYLYHSLFGKWPEHVEIPEKYR